MSSDYNHLQLLTADDGRCLLLDIEHDRILHLNSVGAQMWSQLRQGVAEPEIITQISSNYQVSEERVGADLRGLLRKIHELRIAPTNSTFTDCATAQNGNTERPFYPWYSQGGDLRPAPKASMVLASLVGLAIFDLILWLSSLRVLCSCVKAWPLRGRKPNSNLAGQMCSAVERASTWYPKQALCLQRSAVTTCLLRSHGLAARMMIGLRPMPFLAHAWVEVEGAVVNDWRPVTKFYQTLVGY